MMHNMCMHMCMHTFNVNGWMDECTHSVLHFSLLYVTLLYVSTFFTRRTLQLVHHGAKNFTTTTFERPSAAASAASSSGTFAICPRLPVAGTTQPAAGAAHAGEARGPFPYFPASLSPVSAPAFGFGPARGERVG